MLHLDKHLQGVIDKRGAGSTYGVLWAIVFAETGFVLTPFLPGGAYCFCALRPRPDQNVLLTSGCMQAIPCSLQQGPSVPLAPCAWPLSVASSCQLRSLETL